MSPDLSAPFTAVGTSFSVPDETLNHLLQDTAATAARNYYRLEASKP